MAEQLTPGQLANRLGRAQRAVVMTGAGISTAAGIPDFRGPNGLYRSGRYDAARVFEIDAFVRDPSEFYRFTRDLAEVLETIEPTFTHRLLAQLEGRGLLRGVITQNIDPLHQQAGSRNVCCVHGSYATSRCLSCGRSFDYAQLKQLLAEHDVPRCDCAGGGLIKPDIVFFGEAVRDMETAGRWAAESDVMLVLGSSLAVYPAAMLPAMAGGEVITVNLGPVELPEGPGRHFVQADLDAYFREVAGALDVEVDGG
jgi:NAD-dependent deacetylase